MFAGKEGIENLFFSVVCISIFTCLVRSDYNFAIGLLCYYVVKNAGEKLGKIATTVSDISLDLNFRFVAALKIKYS